MALANSLRKTASKLVKKFGGDVTVRAITVGAYNTVTGTASETALDTTVKGVLEDVNLREVNELVQAGDRKLTVAAADLSSAPTTADKVLISGVTHQIIRVVTIEQDNQAVTHELILRN